MIHRHQGLIEEHAQVSPDAGGFCFTTNEGVVRLAKGATAPSAFFRASRGVTFDELRERKASATLGATALIESLRESVREAAQLVQRQQCTSCDGHFYYLVHRGPECRLTEQPTRPSQPFPCYLDIDLSATLLLSPEALPISPRTIPAFAFERGGPLPNLMGRFPEPNEPYISFLKEYMRKHVSPLAREALLGS